MCVAETLSITLKLADHRGERGVYAMNFQKKPSSMFPYKVFSRDTQPIAVFKRETNIPKFQKTFLKLKKGFLFVAFYPSRSTRENVIKWNRS